MHVALLCIRLFLAGLFMVAAVLKLADLGGSRAAVAGFGVPARIAPVLGTLLPFAELAVAVALIPAGSARLGALGAAVLLGMLALTIARGIARGEAPDCHCFGQLHSAPAGRRALARNVALLGAAVFVATVGWANAGPSASAWIGRLDAAGALALGGGVAIVLLACVTGWALLAVLRQNGRLLVRIEELEERLDASGAPPTRVPQHGLPLGEPAPDFTLQGLYGESVTLASLTAAERPVVLLFTDPNCGPCNALMPRISGWQREHGDRLTLAILTRGSAAENLAEVREHGIANVWIDAGLEVYSAYEMNGTPGAVLIDAQARIASAPVAGAERIAELVARATEKPLVPVIDVPVGEPARPRPLVPPVGAPIPSLDIHDLAGKPVSLTAADRDTVVLFWNPQCGFCQQMLDDLRAFEHSPPPDAPRLLLISSGSAADNAAQALSAPIALDSHFAAGTAFGATGTPSAIRVDTNSRIASTLAVGAPQVIALLGGLVKGAPSAAEPVRSAA